MKGQYLDPPIKYACSYCKDETTWSTLKIPRILYCVCGWPMTRQDTPTDTGKEQDHADNL